MTGSTVLLTREDLALALRDVIVRLRGTGRPVELRIIGGAAIALWHNAERSATRDIDAIYSPAEAVKAAADDIAIARGWPRDWFNDAAAGFLPSGMGARGEEWTVAHVDGDVTVLAPSLDMLLAMKLHAAQRRPLREYEDLRSLLTEARVSSADEAERLYEDSYPGDGLNAKAYEVVSLALDDPPPTRVGSIDLSLDS